MDEVDNKIEDNQFSLKKDRTTTDAIKRVSLKQENCQKSISTQKLSSTNHLRYKKRI